jgi:hypothetical protein
MRYAVAKAALQVLAVILAAVERLAEQATLAVESQRKRAKAAVFAQHAAEYCSLAAGVRAALDRQVILDRLVERAEEAYEAASEAQDEGRDAADAVCEDRIDEINSI